MKQVTFTEPMIEKKYVETTQEAVTCRVVLVAIQLDPRTFRKSVHTQLGIFDSEDRFIKCLDPIVMDMPDSWMTTMDTLDGKILTEVKNTFSVETKTGVPDGSVGNFDSEAVALKIEEAAAAAAALKVEEVIK